MSDYLNELQKAFDDVLVVLSEANNECIAKTENDIGRSMTEDEKKLCTSLLVCTVFLKAFSKYGGDH